MTPLFTAFVSLVGILAVLNMLLTLAMIRRLRLHSEQLAALSMLDDAPTSPIADVGERAGDFAATTTDG
ncbi:hypothetical protein [Allorhizocola rhizosphaerae]|uniref:hypothetical protein n=1 Tax=Allorhizocola rhizosphaerae TaxID=1872709 RepID=UPI000E3C08DF|nr:hypothetical protein [Allorhizocola rhizosphaerae]